MVLKLIQRIRPFGARVPVCAVVLGLLSGCGADEIEHYRVQRMSEPQAAAAPQGASAQRLLGAVVPQEGGSWFFKLLGPVDEVGEQKEAFDAFLRSVRLHPGAEKQITWQAPEGWHEDAGGGFRYATFHIGSDEGEPLELSVSQAGGSVLDNINRWRGQIGLAPISESEMEDSTTRVPIGDATAIVIDETGIGTGKPMGAPFASGARPMNAPRTRPAAPAVSDTPPEDWQPASGSSMSLLAYRVGQGDQQAKVTLTMLPGAAGGVEANIGRWRGQVGLAPNDDTVGERREIDLDGQIAVFVDLPGPASAGAARQRMLGVISQRNGLSWFLKMTGPHDVVAAQKAAFEEWIQSIRFNPTTAGDGESNGS
jgi:hypothetical protein